jgi:hypothetical protein
MEVLKVENVVGMLRLVSAGRTEVHGRTSGLPRHSMIRGAMDRI